METQVGWYAARGECPLSPVRLRMGAGQGVPSIGHRHRADLPCMVSWALLQTFPLKPKSIQVKLAVPLKVLLPRGPYQLATHLSTPLDLPSEGKFV